MYIFSTTGFNLSYQVQTVETLVMQFKLR